MISSLSYHLLIVKEYYEQNFTSRKLCFNTMSYSPNNTIAMLFVVITICNFSMFFLMPNNNKMCNFICVTLSITEITKIHQPRVSPMTA